MYVSKIPSMHTLLSLLPFINSSYVLYNYIATHTTMPRVINGRNRNTTAKAILLKPYERPITHALDTSVTSTIAPEQVKSREEVKPVKKGEYNKTHLVALIVKVCLSLEQADNQASTPDWDRLSKSINKTPTRTYPFDGADGRMSRYMEENYFSRSPSWEGLVELWTWVG
jgi:hypothetical protein